MVSGKNFRKASTMMQPNPNTMESIHWKPFSPYTTSNTLPKKVAIRNWKPAINTHMPRNNKFLLIPDMMLTSSWIFLAFSMLNTYMNTKTLKITDMCFEGPKISW